MVESINLFNSLNYHKEEYDSFSDEELITKIRIFDYYAENCLYKKYASVVKYIASSYFFIDGGFDDLFQEAMIGLIKAVKSYDVNSKVFFRKYAEICIRRQIISAIRKSKVYGLIKHDVCIFNCPDIENDLFIMDKINEMEKLNPENLYINKEEKNNCFENLSVLLSEFEKDVLNECYSGKSYKEISLAMDKNVKSIENALQRIKRKNVEIKKLRI